MHVGTTATPEAPVEAMPHDPDLDRVSEPDTSLTVVQALNRVMLNVTVLRKDREQRSEAGSFRFRGIDDVMNAVGPAFRRHGVICLPNLLDVGVEHATTSKGKPMTVTRVQVEYTFYGPAGDSITCRTPGEAFDSGDKSTAKAMSVAYRTALLQALTLPTDEPDPDETVEELAPRQQAQQRRPQQAKDSDPWRPDLLATEKHALAVLMNEDDQGKLTAAWHEAKRVQEEFVYLTVKPTDLSTAQALILGIREPTHLVEVVGRIGKHLSENGISVAEHIQAERGDVAHPSEIES